MKFKYSAFTNNTPEMREWLRSIGVKIHPLCHDGDILVVHGGDAFTLSSRNIGFLEKDDSLIDCRSNPSLFQAVTAIREDSDAYQWFCSPLFDEWEFCEVDMFHAPSEYDFHKATLSELQEHFKIEEK